MASGAPGLFQTFQIALCVERCHTTRAGTGDGLTVNMILHVTRRKHARVGGALQRVVQTYAMARVQRQARALQPSTTACLRDYHYQKQKSNAFYHVQTANLPFQNNLARAPHGAGVTTWRRVLITR